MDDTDLRSILRETLGTKAEIETRQLLKDKPDYRVWDVSLRRPRMRLIVKLAGAGARYSSRFERTVAIHRLVQSQTAIPMPEVLLADESCHKWPWKVFIKTYIPGQELAEIRAQMSEEERRAAMAEIGDAVAQIHSIRFEGFGDVSSDGQVSPALNCVDGLTDHAQRILDRLGQDGRMERFLAAFEPRKPLFAGVEQACVCHEDLHIHNILFERHNGAWKLATILDFEKSWAGPADCDLARMELWSMTGEAFWQAYTARLPIHPNRKARWAILQYLWCLEVNWDTPEHRATTAAVLQELNHPTL